MKPALTLLFLCAACGTKPEAPTNVVLISIDTLRPEVLGVYGGDPELTPTIDALGAEGVVFENAVAQAPWTWPSHASLFTSRDPAELSVGSFDEPRPLPGGALTLAEVLSGQGFATAAVTGGGYLSEGLDFDRGFDFFFGDFACREMSITVSSALNWLRRRTDSRPFFLFMHTWEVHQYDPPFAEEKRWVRDYDGPLYDHGELGLFLQGGANRAKIAGLDEADWRYVRDVYRACAASVDRELARFMKQLEELELLDSTLIVLLSDHGEEFGEHGGGGHGYSLFDENLRVPLIMRHPSLGAGRVGPQVRLLDVAPTIVDLLGLIVPAAWEGESLVPRMGGEGVERFAVASNGHRPGFAVRSGRYKSLFLGPDDTRVFDLQNDPHEHTPLSPEEGKSILARHRAALVLRLEAAVRGRAALARHPSDVDAELEAELARLGYVGGEPAETRTIEEWLRLLGEN